MCKKDQKFGSFQNFNHPDKAVKLSLSSYNEYSVSYSFKAFKQGKSEVEQFYCPSCSKESEYTQEHGDAYKCGKCGLNRQSFGNALYVWASKLKKQVRKEDFTPMF